MSSNVAGRGVGVRRGNILGHVVLIAGLVVIIGPLVWQVLTSLKTYSESVAVPPVVFPAVPQVENYETVFESLPLAAMLANSIIATFLRVTVQLFLCAAA